MKRKFLHTKVCFGHFYIALHYAKMNLCPVTDLLDLAKHCFSIISELRLASFILSQDSFLWFYTALFKVTCVCVSECMCV